MYRNVVTIKADRREDRLMPQLVSYRADGRVATITMDDGKVNALSAAMLAGIGTALDRAQADRMVVLLTGRPGILSAGFDLNVLRAGGDPARHMVRSGFELAVRLLSFPAPVVIACPGHAIAMASFLLLSADYRLGADGPYKITANEVSIGLEIPQAAIEICRQRLSPAALSRAVLLSEVFGPAAAQQAGWLDRVVPAEELAGAASALAADLAQLDPAAHTASKLRLRGPIVAAVRAALEADYGRAGARGPVTAR
jgi:enoyl-CoA hydratase